jgi:hypothetical protein
MRMLRIHRFTPRILKSADMRRKATRGYPRVLKKRVARTIAPKKRFNCWVASGRPVARPFLSSVFFPFKKSLRRNPPDNSIRRIPRQKGNIPAPAIRKVPRGMLRDKTAVTPPKKKKRVALITSSLFTVFLRTFNPSGLRH